MDLTCKLCSFKTSMAQNFGAHFNLCHKVSAHSLMMCGAMDCYAQFHSLERYIQHININHTRPITQLNVERTNNPVAATEHQQLSSQDPSDSELLIQCPHPSCSYKCTSKSTLRSHRFRYHKSATLPETSANPTATTDNDLSQYTHQEPCSGALSFYSQGIEAQDTQVPNDGGGIEADFNSEEILFNKFVHIYLTLTSKFHIPDSTLDYIINDYHLLLKHSLGLLSTKLLSKLTSFGIDCDPLKPLIESIFSEDTLIRLHSADGPMRSRYMRRQQYTKLFEFVNPISYNLGLNQNNIQRKYHYVSIEKTLKAFFDDTSVYEQYTERKNKEVTRSHVLTDIEDGSLFQTHPVFSSDPSSIQLIIYQDDMEIVNPLGSGKGVYKLTAYYYTLANLHPWSRSSVDPLQLILLCRETDVAYFGLPRVLKPLIDELKKLEDHGLEIRGQNLKVNILVLLGDNLGTHTVSGFVENFSTAKYFCRYCEESRDEWFSRMNRVSAGNSNNPQSDVESEASSSESEISCYTSSTEEEGSENDETQRVPRPVDCDLSEEEEVEERSIRNIENDVEEEDRELPFVAPMRTKEAYNMCVAGLVNRPEGVKGIVADSQFNKLTHYHVVGATPPCLPHDILEGLGAHDAKLAVTYLSKKYKFTIESLNRKIASFSFVGDESRDRPSKIGERSKTLGGQAVQNWVLIRFLPMLIGDAVTNKKDPVWRMVLLLIEILQMITSPKISSNILPDLHNQIQQYLHLRKINFPSMKLRPKHHFLEHYPKLISIFGPLMRLSTLRFESKHTFFKPAVRSQKNFKNITKSLTLSHQLLQSSLSINNLFNNYPVLKDDLPFRQCVLEDGALQCVLNAFGQEFANSMSASEKLSYHGTAYEKGKILVANTKDHPVLDLCKIILFLTRGKAVYAVGKKYEGLLDPDLQLYQLKYTGTYILVSLSEIADYVPYSIYRRGTNRMSAVDNIDNTTSDLDSDVDEYSTNDDRPINEQNGVEKFSNDLGHATTEKSNSASTSRTEINDRNHSGNNDNTMQVDASMKMILEKLTPYLQTAEDKTVLLERLFTLGIKTLSDLKFVTNMEKDFSGVIKPIQCRRLEAELLKEDADSSESGTQNVSMCRVIDANKLFSKQFMEKLTGSQRLSNSDRLKFVRRVGDEVYDNMRPVTKHTCIRIAAGLIKNYEGALDFLKHDEVGVDSLATQIHAHASYMKKLDNKRKSLVEDDPDDPAEKKASRKRFSVRENFGINKDMDLPNELPEDETVDSQKEKQKRMQQMAETGEIDMRLVIQFMIKTYPSQRASIAQGLNMEDIIKLWPFIGYFAVLKQHFFTLIPEIEQVKVGDNLNEIVSKMLQFLRADSSKTRKGKLGIATNNILEILKRFDKQQPTTNLQRIAMTMCLGERMQQDMTKIFIFFEETTSFDEIQASSKLPDSGKPIVAVLGSDLMNNPKCYVVVEKRCISPEKISPFKALMLTFMAYFVFKITYPQEVGGLLEFFQRAIYDIKGDETTKSSSRVERRKSAKGVLFKNPPMISPQFKTLMRDFDNYRSLWGI